VAVCGGLASLGRNSAGARCAREAARLSRLSDDELAAAGLSRDRILRHAFRGCAIV
jgi:hypothetical protein